ncbi:MAG: pyridoxamine 5'-phosphate oxidase family protein [Candidatus Omnitrophica bacterium]|nr:pyridoxamine 5'-phosphate oxidase family protein [Candidatus Omnitrophota bacterium]
MKKEEVIDLIRDAGFGYLATLEGDQPRVRPMMPYLVEDTGEILVALLGRSRSIEQIRKNPRVELCFVDRKMWYCRIAGQARITTDIEKKTILWENIPMLKQYFGGPQDPDFVLAEIKIDAVEAMTPHQKTPDKIQF